MLTITPVSFIQKTNSKPIANSPAKMYSQPAMGGVSFGSSVKLLPKTNEMVNEVVAKILNPAEQNDFSEISSKINRFANKLFAEKGMKGRKLVLDPRFKYPDISPDIVIKPKFSDIVIPKRTPDGKLIWLSKDQTGVTLTLQVAKELNTDELNKSNSDIYNIIDNVIIFSSENRFQSEAKINEAVQQILQQLLSV